MTRNKLLEDSLGGIARQISDAQPGALADAMEALERSRKLLSPLTDAMRLAGLETVTRSEDEMSRLARLSDPLGKARAALEAERSAVEDVLSVATDISDATRRAAGIPTSEQLNEIHGAIGIENDFAETARKLRDPLGINSSLDNALRTNNAVESLRATDTLRDAISAAIAPRDVLEEHKRMSDWLNAAQPYRGAYDAAADALSAVSAPSARNIPAPPARSGSARKKVTSAKAIGELVREARRKMELNQQEFADLAGVGRRFVSELETGKPTLEFDKVMQACAAAGIDVTAASRSAS